MNFQEKTAALRVSLEALNVAGRQLNTTVRRHASRILRENVRMASAMRADLATLARSTLRTLSDDRTGATRKRSRAGRR